MSQINIKVLFSAPLNKSSVIEIIAGRALCEALMVPVQQRSQEAFQWLWSAFGCASMKVQDYINVHALENWDGKLNHHTFS